MSGPGPPFRTGSYLFTFNYKYKICIRQSLYWMDNRRMRLGSPRRLMASRSQLPVNELKGGPTSLDGKHKAFNEQQFGIYPRGLKLVDYVNRDEVDVDMKRNVQGMRVNVANMVSQQIAKDKQLLAKAAKSVTEYKKQLKTDSTQCDEKGFAMVNEESTRESTRESAASSTSKSKLDILESITISAWMSEKVKAGEVPITRWNYLCAKFQQYHGEIMQDLINDLEVFSLYSDGDSNSISCIETVLQQHEYSKADIRKWVKCFESRSLKEALQYMTPEDKWPQFLALFTLKRNVKSSIEAYEAIRVYQRVLPKSEPVWQMPLFLRALRICKKALPDYIPIITRIFVLHAHDDVKTQSNYNHLLWQLSSFGTSLIIDHTKFLSEAQRIVVADIKSCHSDIFIDTKGYLGLGYTLSIVAVDKAKVFIDVVKKHNYPYSKEELLALNENESHGLKNIQWGRFPYLHGLYALELTLARNAAEGFRIFDSIPKNCRIAILYVFLLTRLRNLGELTTEIAEIIWQHVRKDQIRLTPLLLVRFLEVFDHSSKIFDEIKRVADNQGVYLGNSNLRNQFFYQLAKKDLMEASSIFNKIPHKTIELYEMLMKVQLQVSPINLWDTFCALKKDGFEPSIDILVMLCRTAASNPFLKWGNMYAAQQAVVEFKSWVRGANIDGSDAHDIFKLYPTTRLLHSYITMLGRAGYGEGLLDVLPWLERIKFVPDKKLLCAIIHYSPNGEYLLKHGSCAGGDWPTRDDVELYKSMNRL